MTVNLTDPIFHDEEAARQHFEAIRWPDRPVCPHCGVVANATELKGASTRPGVYKCKDCRKPFTATIGTLYERSHIPLHKWLLAFRLMASSKKGCSVHQLHRTLGITYKSAWFLAHRIREAMRDDGSSGPIGGKGKVIEADETYFSKLPIKVSWNFSNETGWTKHLMSVVLRLSLYLVFDSRGDLGPPNQKPKLLSSENSPFLAASQIRELLHGVIACDIMSHLGLIPYLAVTTSRL